MTSASSPVCPWAWPCRCSPPCCLETCGSRGACGVGATGSPAGRFPGREGSSMPLLRFPLTRARCLPSAQAGAGTPSPLAFRSPRVSLPPPAGRMLPCEPGWGSLGSREAQRGPEPCDLGPATPPLPTRPLRGLSIHASGVHGLRKVSDPKGLSDADLDETSHSGPT